MTAHLPEQTLLDLAEGNDPSDSSAHLMACASCAGRIAEAREALALARLADVPEPSPLYWDAFRRNVGRRIVETPGRTVRWGWLVPLASATVAAVALSVLPVGPRVAPSVPAAPSATLASWSALPPVEEDAGLPVLEAVALHGEELGPLDGRGLGPFLASLSDEEMSALAETLRRQRKGGDL